MSSCARWSCFVYVLLLCLVGVAVPSQNRSRAQVIEAATQLSELEWTAVPGSDKASCLHPPAYSGPRYVSDYHSGQEVTGMPYDWGGMDSPNRFLARLQSGRFGAGSHKEHECSGCKSHCTVGIDCSGLVSYCWGLSRHYGTSEIAKFAQPAPESFDVFKDLKPGDALNRPGVHIVLFAGYNEKGQPLVYEAAGKPISRVVKRPHAWADLEGYSPLLYRDGPSIPLSN